MVVLAIDCYFRVVRVGVLEIIHTGQMTLVREGGLRNRNWTFPFHTAENVQKSIQRTMDISLGL